MSSSLETEEDYQKQVADLQKTRAMFQALKESTGKIYEDIVQAHKQNNPILLNEARALKETLDKVE